MANTAKVTVPFEAKDLISGALRGIQSILHDVTDDFIDFRRVTDRTNDDFISSSKRARTASEELGRSVSRVSDEVGRLGRERVGDVFSTARRSADEFKRTVDRADSSVKGISDAKVHLSAKDEVSPVLEGLTSKIATLAATAGGLIIGGGIKDAVFGDLGNYYSESSRSAGLLSPNVRQQGLTKADDLYAQGYFNDRAEAAKQVADIAPLTRDKSQVGDFLEASAKQQYIRPDAGLEEINRALAQTADTFKETYSKVSDSMTYAYQQVGDRQQDLYDTFWEYSGYFRKTGASSGQMANFLVKNVQDGAFNFDKPADFFKEVFGVKALSQSDMANYFALRGAGPVEAQRQAAAFSADINSGDEQKMKGALAAFIGDLSSQTQAQLKQSLVTLGSATAEDNGDAVLRNFRTAFEAAPKGISGSTDRLVNAQRAANPLQDSIETRRQIGLELQDIGTNISSAGLPALQQFNDLLVANKDEISNLGSGIANFVGGITKLYSEHFRLINGVLGTILSGFILKKGVDTYKGARDLYGSLKAAGGWVYSKLPGRKKGSPLASEFGDMVSGASTMTINASVVYLNGSIGGGGGGIDVGTPNGKGRKTKGRKGATGKVLSEIEEVGGGARKGGPRANLPGSYRPAGKQFWDNIPLDKTHSRDDVVELANRGKLGKLNDLEKTFGKTAKTSWWRNLISGGGDAAKEAGAASKILKGGSKLLKGAGIVGTVASVGLGGLDLYQASKDKGLREGISTRGGSLAGSIAGGTLGGIIGSAILPGIGTAAGAAVGGWAGEKLGSWSDSSGLTRKVVDGTVKLKDSVVSFFTGTDKNSKKAEKSFEGISTGAKTAASQTEQHLTGLKGISDKGTSWGSDLILKIVAGIESKFPQLSAEITRITNSITGITSKYTQAPASRGKAMAYADGGVIRHPHFGLVGEAGPEAIIPLSGVRRKRGIELWEQAGAMLGVRKYANGGIVGGITAPSVIPVVTTLSQEQAKGAESVSIGNVTLDFSGIANGISDFASFAKMLTSPQGRALIRDTVGEEMLKALENGG